VYILMALQLLVSCGGAERDIVDSGAARPGAGQAPAFPVAALPPLSALGGQTELPDYRFRTVSSVVSVAKNGSATFNYSSNVTREFPELVIDSDADTLEWAVYTLQVGAFTPRKYEVSATVENGDCYYALADFATDSWRVLGPFAGGFSHSPTVSEKLVDGLNYRSFIAVLAWGGTDVRVEQVSFEFEQPEYVEVELENVGLYGDISATPNYHHPERWPLLGVIDRNDGRLELWQADTAYPTSIDDWDDHVVDTQDSALFRHLSLNFSADRPAIAYTTSEDVRYAGSQLQFPDRSDDWVITTISNTEGNVPALMQSSDELLPMVSWGDDKPGDNHVWFASADQILPESNDDWSRHWLDIEGAALAGYCSITLVEGKPWVLYYYPNDETDYKVAMGEEQVPSNTFEWQRVAFGFWDDLGAVVSPYAVHQYPLTRSGFTTFCGFDQELDQEPFVALVQDIEPPIISTSDPVPLLKQAQANSLPLRYCDVTLAENGLYYFAALVQSDSGDPELWIGYGLSINPYFNVNLERAFYIARYSLDTNWDAHQLQLVVSGDKPLLFYLSAVGGDYHLRQLYQAN
jgi:hypothetical protein